MKFISKLDYFNKVYHIRRILAVLYQFIHPDDATQTFSFEEQVESFVNIVEAHFVCYKLAQIELLQIKSTTVNVSPGFTRIPKGQPNQN